LTVATEFTLINLSMTNFNLQKCDETYLKEYLPDITLSIWNKTSCHGQRACLYGSLNKEQW